MSFKIEVPAQEIDLEVLPLEDGEDLALRPTRLTGTILIGGISCHIDLIEVETKGGLQSTVEPADSDDFHYMGVIAETDGPFATINILHSDGSIHEYVPVAFAYSD